MGQKPRSCPSVLFLKVELGRRPWGSSVVETHWPLLGFLGAMKQWQHRVHLRPAPDAHAWALLQPCHRVSASEPRSTLFSSSSPRSRPSDGARCPSHCLSLNVLMFYGLQHLFLGNGSIFKRNPIIEFSIMNIVTFMAREGWENFNHQYQTRSKAQKHFV